MPGFDKRRKLWCGRINFRKEQFWLGHFETRNDALEAEQAKRREIVNSCLRELTDLQFEVWKPICETHQISNLGRIKRVVYYHSSYPGFIQFTKQKGYLGFRFNGKGKNFVHYFVLIIFIS